MASDKAKVMCPECGVEMNHHASKLEYPTCAEEVAKVDPVFGALLEDAHCCPDCGKGSSRRSPY